MVVNCSLHTGLASLVEPATTVPKENAALIEPSLDLGGRLSPPRPAAVTFVTKNRYTALWVITGPQGAFLLPAARPVTARMRGLPARYITPSVAWADWPRPATQNEPPGRVASFAIAQSRDRDVLG